MIRAELTAIHCLEVPSFDFSDFRPDDPTCFSCALQLFVGVHNQGGAEAFQLTICTPQWLVENHSEEDIVIGKNLIIVFDFNYPRIVQWLNLYMEHCAGDTWADVWRQVSRIGSSDSDVYPLSPLFK